VFSYIIFFSFIWKSAQFRITL